MPDCRPRVFLTYINGDRHTPYKWAVECPCGWRGLSWSWSRAYDMNTSNLSPEQWVEENGQPEGGAFVMALEHVGLAPKQVWRPLFPPLSSLLTTKTD